MASAEFTHADYVITAVSALAFAVLIGADLLLIYLPELPRWFGIAIIVAALWGDVEFMQWYPERAK